MVVSCHQNVTRFLERVYIQSSGVKWWKLYLKSASYINEIRHFIFTRPSKSISSIVTHATKIMRQKRKKIILHFSESLVMMKIKTGNFEPMSPLPSCFIP